MTGISERRRHSPLDGEHGPGHEVAALRDYEPHQTQRRLLDACHRFIQTDSMLGIFAAAFALYTASALLVLGVINALLRRWRTITGQRLLICSLLSASIALTTFYILVTFHSGNVSGGSGIGAIVLAVAGFAAGAVIGGIALLILAWCLSSKLPYQAHLASRARAANLATLRALMFMLPGIWFALLIADRELALLPSFAGMLLGLPGLRENMLLVPGKDSLTVTRGLLWAGLVGTLTIAGSAVTIYFVTGSLLHVRQPSMLIIVLATLAVPVTLFIRHLSRLRQETGQTA